MNSLTLNTLPTLELAAGSPSGYSLDFSTPNTIRLIAGTPPPPPTVVLYWTGATDNTWDTSTQNWTDTSIFTTFGANDDVNFVDGGLNRNILLNTAINIGNATFSANTDAYSIGGTGAIASTKALTKTGSGMVTLSVAGGVSLGSISVSGGTLALATNTSAAALSITGGARLSAVGSFGAVSVSGGGKFDVTDSDVIVDYTGASPIQSIRSQLASGYVSGNWNGAGINSSVAAADPAHRAALGYAEASTLGLSTFGGQSLDGSAVVIEYTLQGDTNLDGVVNALDFNALATHFGAVRKPSGPTATSITTAWSTPPISRSCRRISVASSRHPQGRSYPSLAPSLRSWRRGRLSDDATVRKFNKFVNHDDLLTSAPIVWPDVLRSS